MAAGFGLVLTLVLTSFGGNHGQVVEPIRRNSIVESVYGIGTLTAQRSLAIKGGVMTGVNKFYVKEGDRVEKGDRLFDLDGSGPIYAPFSGTIVSSPMREGEAVFAQTAIMTLVDLSDSYLVVSLEQPGMLKVKTGQTAQISFDGFREKAFVGRVESVYSNGVDFLARISVKDLPPVIVPGMTADVAIVLQKKDGVLLAPVAALDGSSVAVVRNGREMKIPVKLGLNDGAYAEVADGDIQEGDQALLLASAKAKK